MDVSIILHGIWLATFILVALFALYSWIWTESPNGDLLVGVVLAAGFMPITVLLATLLLLTVLPTLLLGKIRDIVQAWKTKTVK